MAQDPNPAVTLAGSGVLLHVLNPSGEPIPVAGTVDGAIDTSGGGGGGGGAVTQSTGATATPWYMQGVNGGVAERLATHALQGAGLPNALTPGGGVKVGLVDELPAGTQTIGKTDQGAAGATSWKTVEDNSPAIKAAVEKIPAQGQALAASSMPVVLPLTQAAGALALQAQLPEALVSGRLSVDVGATSGLTDTQLRASAVPTSIATLPALATGTNTIGAVTAPGAAALALDATLTSGLQVAIAKGPIAVGAAVGSEKPVLVGGTDGTNAQLVNVDSTGAVRLQSGGTPGSAAPTRATQIGGSDGTNLRALKMDTSGRPDVTIASGTVTATVSGVATSRIQTDGTQKSIVRGGAKGATTAADVTSTAGGTDRNSLDVALRDANGATVGFAAVGQAPSGSPVPIGGVNNGGTTIRFLTSGSGAMAIGVFNGSTPVNWIGDASGRAQVVGAAASGAAVAGNPNLTGGSDGTNARTFAATVAGSQIVTFDASNVGAFGDLIAEPKTALFGKNFGSNVFVSQVDSTTIVTSGVADINANLLRLQTGVTSGASALYNSVKIATYREGQGMQIRFTAAYTTGIANSTQIVGAFTPDFANGYGFGYNGTSFAIFHRNGGADSTVANTYPLAQASWNGNVPSGFDPTKGNVYRIDYPYLGYGDIRFYIQDSASGQWFLVHTIRYANVTTTVQLAEPALQFCARALSVSSTTNLTLLVGSYGAFLIGERFFNGPQWSRGNTVTLTTLAQVIAIRNCTTFNTKTNKRIARVRSFSASADGGNGTTQIRWFITPTVGGTPVFTPFNGSTADNGVTLTNAQSILSYDIAGTTITGGDEILGTMLSRNAASGLTDLSALNIIILPGQTLVLGATATASATVGITLNGNED